MRKRKIFLQDIDIPSFLTILTVGSPLVTTTGRGAESAAPFCVSPISRSAPSCPRLSRSPCYHIVAVQFVRPTRVTLRRPSRALSVNLNRLPQKQCSVSCIVQSALWLFSSRPRKNQRGSYSHSCHTGYFLPSRTVLLLLSNCHIGPTARLTTLGPL